MNNIFFTSDTHFGHKNIIRYCNRPFSSVEEMDVAMIERWNEVVGPSDTVYHLGDFSINNQSAQKYVGRLNGEIHLILGNHDKKVKMLRPAFASINHYLELRYKSNPDIILFHYAMTVWNKKHHGAWHLYGHSHGNLPDQMNKSIDVGVDTNNFYPYHFDEVARILNKRPTFSEQLPVDHHK